MLFCGLPFSSSLINPIIIKVFFVSLAKPSSHFLLSLIITSYFIIASSIKSPIRDCSEKTRQPRPISLANLIYFAILLALYSILPEIGSICAIAIYPLLKIFSFKLLIISLSILKSFFIHSSTISKFLNKSIIF